MVLKRRCSAKTEGDDYFQHMRTIENNEKKKIEKRNTKKMRNLKVGSERNE